MNNKYQGLASAIDDSNKKVTTIFLLCDNPVSQQVFDNNAFLPPDWVTPYIVAADGTFLAYYCPINKFWVSTKAKASWINQSAKPNLKLLEIKSFLQDFLSFLG